MSEMTMRDQFAAAAVVNNGVAWTKDDLETLLSDALTDSFDQDWDASDGVRAIMRALKREGLAITAIPQDDARSIIRELVSGVEAYLMTGDVMTKGIKENVWRPVLRRAYRLSNSGESQ